MLGFRLNLARFADFRAVSLPVEAPTVGGRNALRVADCAYVSVGHANNGRDALRSQPSGGQPAHFAVSSALHRPIAIRSRKDRIDCRLPWRAGAWRVRIR